MDFHFRAAALLLGACVLLFTGEVAGAPARGAVTAGSGSISGVVRAAETLQPLSGIEVSLLRPGSSLPAGVAVTDGAGGYAFTDVAAGAFTLVARDAAQFTMRLPAIYPDLACDDWLVSCSDVSLDQTIEEGAHLHGMDLRMQLGARMEVVPVDAATGQVIAWPPVALFLAESVESPHPDSGAFPADTQHFGPLQARQYRVEFHDASGSYSPSSTIVDTQAGEVAYVVLQLQSRIVLRGRFLTLSGEPVDGLAVAAGRGYVSFPPLTLHQTPSFALDAPLVETLPDGSFAIGGVGSGSRVVRSFSNGEFVNETASGIRCTVDNFFCNDPSLPGSAYEAGEHDVGDIVLSPAGRISGVVYDPVTHLPVNEARVHLLHPTSHVSTRIVWTAANGRYVHGALPPGDYFLVAELPGVDGHSELYPGVHCEWELSDAVPACAMQGVSPITVSAGELRQGIDFFAGHSIFRDGFGSN